MDAAASESAYIISQIRRIFNEETFNVDIIENDSNIQFFGKDKNNKICINLTIDLDEKKIYINELERCNAGKGPLLLDKVDELARMIQGITSIELEDKSILPICGVNINLAILKILTKGESWYNSKGYYGASRENEKHNRQIINQSFKDMLIASRDAQISQFLTDNAKHVIEQNICIYEDRIKTLIEKKGDPILLQNKLSIWKSIIGNYDEYIRTEVTKITQEYTFIHENAIGLDNFDENESLYLCVSNILNLCWSFTSRESDTCNESQRKIVELLNKIVEFMKRIIQYDNSQLIKRIQFQGGATKKIKKYSKKNKKKYRGQIKSFTRNKHYKKNKHKKRFTTFTKYKRLI
jgi:hypothetical protein